MAAARYRDVADIASANRTSARLSPCQDGAQQSLRDEETPVRLKDRVVLVTGGGSGVGAAIAERSAQEGARVVIAGRDEAKLHAVCRAVGERIDGFPCDIRDRERVRVLVDHVLEQHDHIDVLVNNAGVNVVDRAMDRISPEDWDLMMDVNATGAFNLLHAVLPHMRKRGGGVVISISSMAGLRPGTVAGVGYSASKRAMAVLTRMVDIEDSRHRIRATVISPGEIDTPILEHRPVKVTDEHRARILRPEDVAEAVVYVASQPPRVCIPELVIKPLGQGA